MTTIDTVLVTGAFGQVGQRTTELLLARGRTVVALDLRTDRTQATAARLTPSAGQPGRLVPAYVDLMDGAAIDALLAEHRPGAIVHLAAVVAPLAYSKPALAAQVNVEGTRLLAEAARAHVPSCLFLDASSASVYGSRNPHRHGDRLTSRSPLNPIDCYGEDKVLAERVVAASGLPHAILRLGGIISPDTLAANKGHEFDVLTRCIPRDNRIHAVDARDVALAFANGVDRGDAIAGKVLLIGGDESFALTQSQLEDDIYQALGIGRLSAGYGQPGDPDDDRGWGLTDWFDTTESQQLLGFQAHTWQQTLDGLAAAAGVQRLVLRVVGPVVRRSLERKRRISDERDGRGRYAEPWKLVEQHFGTQALASGRL